MGARQNRRNGRALTVPQVCHELNVGRVTVYGLIDSGELPAFRVGKNYRIEPEDLERYKTQGKAQVQAHGATGAAVEGATPREEGDRP
ncbi:MAG: helix-turn-helix domain-containing protein [Chloroflexota bacterium]|nr:helix-turn-helix domain-containing protein [Chloroflexota bacterium]